MVVGGKTDTVSDFEPNTAAACGLAVVSATYVKYISAKVKRGASAISTSVSPADDQDLQIMT